MQYSDLEEWSRRAAEWAGTYYQGLRDRPVRAQVEPGEIFERIAEHPPEQAESMDKIFDDFKEVIPAGMTHWQHPRFFAYFNSNAAPASILAEQLANVFSAQCMLWQTSPAATELEARMVDWLRQSFGLPETYRGVIQDSATSATLSAILTMRERALNWTGVTEGLTGAPTLRIYCSDQVHSSIDKGVRLAGIGQNNLVKIGTDNQWSMDAQRLQNTIRADREKGYLPAGVIGCIGGTSIGASDNLKTILKVSDEEGMYSHVDAAWAGAAMICEEMRSSWAGIELADSIVINPHKWLGANFDCSIQFLKQPQDQIRTLAIKPAYLQSLENEHITNYSEWVIPLGRRFRALKLWFLIRCYGLEGLRERIRNHVQWTHWAADQISATDGLEVATPPMFALFTFQVSGSCDRTRKLLEAINADGRTYLTQTNHEGKFVIRMTMGQFDCQFDDVQVAVEAIREIFSSQAAL